MEEPIGSHLHSVLTDGERGVQRSNLSSTRYSCLESEDLHLVRPDHFNTGRLLPWRPDDLKLVRPIKLHHAGILMLSRLDVTILRPRYHDQVLDSQTLDQGGMKHYNVLSFDQKG